MKTLLDKIWDSHVAGARGDGLSLIHVDRHVLHDLHAPPAFQRLAKSGYPLRRPDLTIAVTDHTVSTLPNRSANSTLNGAEFLAATRAGANRYGINSTPSIVIDGTLRPEMAEWTALKAELDKELASK